ncbi:MAG: tripartite tricarboxylate transporter permease [bacterium]
MDTLTCFFGSAATAIIAAMLGACLGAFVPSLHILNLLAVLALAAQSALAAGAPFPPEAMIVAVAAFLTSWSLANTIPAVLAAAPDEGALFTVLPGQRYLMEGRGAEAVWLTVLGGVGGLGLLLSGLPFAVRLLPPLHAILRPHYGWIIWVVIVFMLLSEWPKGNYPGPAGWRKWMRGWRGLGAGLLTFLLSGMLGMILMYRSPLPPEQAFQNLMPAFVGLFGVPGLLFALIAHPQIPAQHQPRTLALPPRLWFRGAAAGALGGAVAAFLPVVTAGVGGLLAGHATATRDERVFLVSQGASKTVYYVGALLLLFVPGLEIVRGGAAWMLTGLYAPQPAADSGLAIGSVALAAAVTLLLMPVLLRLTLALVTRLGSRRLALAALALLLVLVGGLTGLPGLFVMAVASGIGLIPLLYDSRRLNALGVILLPLALNRSAAGPVVARWLGLF